LTPSPLLILASVALAVGLLAAAILSPRHAGRRLFAALLVALAPLPALADAAGVNTAVDLSTVASGAITALSAAALWLGRAAINALIGYLAQRTKLDLDDHTRAYLDQALERAVQYAQSSAERLVGPAASAIDVHNAVVAHAVNYAVDRVPDALAHFGLTPEALTGMVEARIQASAPTLFGSVSLQNGSAVFQDGPAPLPAGAQAGG
jgi:hypothetical protein